MKTSNSRQTTIAIGIPAYNEEANIGHLLGDLSEQTEAGFLIERIIVSSDGSTDKTAEIALAQGDKISLFDNPVRQGVAVRQNQIMETVDTDILVILNADIRIFDRDFINKLVRPVIEEGADLSSCNYLAMPPRTLVGKALAAGLEMKNHVYGSYRRGDNFYTCHGTARAFSRRLYKRLRFKESIGEDAYSYFYAKSLGFKYAYAADALMYIYLPATAQDHLKQSIRFIKTPDLAGREFPQTMVESELKLPRRLLARSLVRSFGKNPFYSLAYLFLYGWTRWAARNHQLGSPDWGVAASTKNSRGAMADTRFSFGSPTAIFFRNICYRLISLLSDMKLEPYPRLFILCYHSVAAGGWRFSVAPKEFKRQIDWLLGHFNPLSLSGVEAFLTGRQRLEKTSFVLTFDDGYADNLEISEYLRTRGVIPAIFLLAFPEEVDRGQLGTRQELLDPAGVKKLIAQGWEIGCHGATHADFSALGEAEIKREIIGAKTELEKRLGIKIDYFSYPKGEHNQRLRDSVRQAGYKLAVSMDDSLIGKYTDRFAVPRIGVDGSHRFKDFKIVFTRLAIHFRLAVKTAAKLKDRFASLRRKGGKGEFNGFVAEEGFGFWQKIRLFFVNRLVTADKAKRAPLPESINDYKLSGIIDRPKGDNQYQFGIYVNHNNEKGILKMWDGRRKDGDWFWLMNEIRTYEGLADLFGAYGPLAEEKYPRIKLPRLLSAIKEAERLGLFVEMIDGETLDKEPSAAKRARYFGEVIGYFQFLGKLIFQSGLEKKFVSRKNIHTILIFFYMLMRSAWMYPRIIPKLAYGSCLFLLDLPYLAANSSLAFVHRDLTYMNVLKLKDGRIGVIDFELAVVTNPLYEITQAVTGSWHLKNFCREFYRLPLVKRIFKDKNMLHSYRALTIFTGIHRLATSPEREFDSHYSYFRHGLKLARNNQKRVSKILNPQTADHVRKPI